MIHISNISNISLHHRWSFNEAYSAGLTGHWYSAIVHRIVNCPDHLGRSKAFKTFFSRLMGLGALLAYNMLNNLLLLLSSLLIPSSVLFSFLPLFSSNSFLCSLFPSFRLNKLKQSIPVGQIIARNFMSYISVNPILPSKFRLKTKTHNFHYNMYSFKK
ncbi:hypothetical protein BDZ97DRAFT_1237365 [Flammula alnicola]|nr:hypothetical protein BDZ97DRAFT_1237365 [Flammula alnicola]